MEIRAYLNDGFGDWRLKKKIFVFKKPNST